MAKRRKARKRTNRNTPAKGRLREMADALWSLAVKLDWNESCAICTKRGDLNSHHLIPRAHTATRHELMNGICLCRHCHIFCPDRSPHQNAAGFIMWLESRWPRRSEWYFEAVKAKWEVTESINAAYYMDLIQTLRPYVPDSDYERVLGVRFAAYLEEQDSA